MSAWTHVAGVIRVDGLFKTNPISLGNECSFDSPEKDWENCDIPKGSEGSLSVAFVKYKTDGMQHLHFGEYLIYGDLRDFDETRLTEIFDWLTRCAWRLKQNQFSIRQGIVQCITGGNTHHIFDFDGVNWQLETKQYD